MSRKDVVVKKGDKYYNTATKRYMTSRVTVDRINSYFRRNPKGNMYEAYGRPKYKEGVKWVDQGKTITKLYQKKTQVVKTKDIDGNVIVYSPVLRKPIEMKHYDKVMKFDYVDGVFHVQLYRLTVNKQRCYHILITPIGKGVEHHEDIEDVFETLRRQWIKAAAAIVKDVSSKYPLVKNNSATACNIVFQHDTTSTNYGAENEGSVTVMRDTWVPHFGREVSGSLHEAASAYHRLLKDYVYIFIRNVKINIYTFATAETKAIGETRLGIFKK